jgi:hypothetical protein
VCDRLREDTHDNDGRATPRLLVPAPLEAEHEACDGAQAEHGADPVQAGRLAQEGPVRAIIAFGSERGCGFEEEGDCDERDAALWGEDLSNPADRGRKQIRGRAAHVRSVG